MGFQKGMRPPGRPLREDTIGDQLRDLLAKDRAAMRIAKRAIDLARGPDEHLALKAIQFIAERVGGKPVQSMDHNVSGYLENPIVSLTPQDFTKS